MQPAPITARAVRRLDRERELVEWGEAVPELALTADYSLALWVRLIAAAAARDLIEEPAHD